MERNTNRLYKSRLFVMIFENKKNLLELYNAISGKDYTDPKLLEINTLENAIYMSMKNDLSFLVDATMLSLYEHQSTYSPNLPLRFLFYLSDLYSELTRKANLYGRKKVKLPTPTFIVFYNGEEVRPEREILTLSEMYETEEPEYNMDLKVLVLNINKGYNQKLMASCHILWEYAQYTERVRRYTKRMPVAAAVDRAVSECIQEGILKDFLEKNRREAIKMSIYEYDQEEHIRLERADAWEEGKLEGRQEGLRELIKKKLSRGTSIEEIARFLEMNETQIHRLLTHKTSE